MKYTNLSIDIFISGVVRLSKITERHTSRTVPYIYTNEFNKFQAEIFGSK